MQETRIGDILITEVPNWINLNTEPLPKVEYTFLFLNGIYTICKLTDWNNPINCIKAIRGLTNLGLKEAKDAYDFVRDNRNEIAKKFGW